MIMKRLYIALLICFGALMLAPSCEKTNPKEDAVVAILKDGNSDYMKQLKYSIEAECQAKGCKAVVVMTNDEYDFESQMLAAESLSSLGYNIKGIIFTPIYDSSNKNDAETVIKTFAGKTVPVVFLDTKPSELSPLKDSYTAYVGVDLQQVGTSFAEMIPESDPSRLLSVYYNTAATVERYRVFKTAKGLSDDSNAIPVTAENGLTADALNSKLSGLGEGGTVTLFNGDFYDKILALGKSVQNLDDKQIYAFDAYKSLLTNLQNGGNVKAVQAQNSFKMGKESVDCIFSVPASKEVLVPAVLINSATIGSDEVKPFLEYFGM